MLKYFDDFLAKPSNDRDLLNEQFKGMTVVASYYRDGKKTYRVESIDFEKNVANDGFERVTFNRETKEKTSKFITFKEYFETQYGVRILRTDQPMLVVKQRDRIDKAMYLVPELCEMTGLTDAHRADFNLMRDLSVVLHKDARTIQNEQKSLIDEFHKQEKAKKLIGDWGINIEKQQL